MNVNIGGKVSDDYALKIYDILRGINEVPDPELIKKAMVFMLLMRRQK